MLYCNKLSKNYYETIALEDCSFILNKGECLGILGPNGSGKSTLIKIITGLILSNKGNVNFSEMDFPDLLTSQVGAVLEDFGFIKTLSARNNLKLITKIKQLSETEIEKVADICNISKELNKKVKHLSLGNKQRLSWARSLLGNPEIFIYDEPTNGLDPGGITDLRKLILKSISEHKSILIASHNLPEMEKICSRVLFLNKGKTIYLGEASFLLSTYGSFENAYLSMINK